MRNLPSRRRALIAWGAACLAYSIPGCSNPITPTAVTLSPTATVFLIPYVSPTQAETATPRAPATPVPIRLPSPTPFTHTIVSGDTVLGIALLYGIEVDRLLAANPGVDPGFLTIGSSLVIPLGEEEAIAAPSPVPLAVELLLPVCYSTAAGDLTCFTQAVNGLAVSIEGVTAQLSLVDQAGNVLFDQQATPPLNLIPAESQMPAVATFAGPLPDPVYATAALLTAFPVQEIDERYSPLDGTDPLITITEDGTTARAAGQIRLDRGSAAAGQIRAAAIAYDEQGRPVGYRVWEANDVLDPGGSLPYEIEVYSLGPPIAQVEVLFEARPITVEGTEVSP